MEDKGIKDKRKQVNSQSRITREEIALLAQVSQ